MFMRLKKGDEFITSLKQITQNEHITASHFTAIGACGELTLSYYNLKEKKYEDHLFNEDMEITGIVGNCGWMNDEPIIHAHGTFGRKDLSVIGGHVKNLIVSATCEITLSILPGKIERKFDAETGLNLIDNSY